MKKLEVQKSIILKLSRRLKSEKIEHHFDGSTAKVIQGFCVSMSDIDIVFPYKNISVVWEFFKEKPLSNECWNEHYGLLHLYYIEENEKVHLLFYKELECSFYDYHKQAELEGEMVWVKGIKHFKSMESEE